MTSACEQMDIRRASLQCMKNIAAVPRYLLLFCSFLCSWTACYFVKLVVSSSDLHSTTLCRIRFMWMSIVFRRCCEFLTAYTSNLRPFGACKPEREFSRTESSFENEKSGNSHSLWVNSSPKLKNRKNDDELVSYG